MLFHWAGLQEDMEEPDYAKLQLEEDMMNAARAAKGKYQFGDAESDDRSGGTANLADLEGELVEP